MSFCYLSTFENNSNKGKLTSDWLSDNYISFGRIILVFLHVLFSYINTVKNQNMLPAFKLVVDNIFALFCCGIYDYRSFKCSFFSH